MGTDAKKPLLIKEDNQSCILLAKQFMVSQRSKHIRIRYHYVRQQIRDGLIDLEYISSKDNTADLFTKPLKPNLFTSHRDTLVKKPLVVPAAEVIEDSQVASCVRGKVLIKRKAKSYACAAKRALPHQCWLRQQWQGSEFALCVCSVCSGHTRC